MVFTIRPARGTKPLLYELAVDNGEPQSFTTKELLEELRANTLPLLTGAQETEVRVEGHTFHVRRAIVKGRPQFSHDLGQGGTDLSSFDELMESVRVAGTTLRLAAELDREGVEITVRRLR